MPDERLIRNPGTIERKVHPPSPMRRSDFMTVAATPNTKATRRSLYVVIDGVHRVVGSVECSDTVDQYLIRNNVRFGSDVYGKAFSEMFYRGNRKPRYSFTRLGVQLSFQ